MEFYPELPVLLALRTDWEGTIWVRRRGEEEEGGNPIDLITAGGRYLGTFAPGSTALPEAFGPDGLVAFVETDDLDVPYVVVKRLPEGVLAGTIQAGGAPRVGPLRLSLRTVMPP